MSYVVETIDLAAVLIGRRVVGPANGVTSWVVLAWPLGTVGFLRMGQSGDRIPITEGLEWEYDLCVGPELGGLYVDLPVAAAGSLVIAVFFGGGTATVGS